MFNYLDVELSQNKILIFFGVAVFLFVFPLIMVDNLYLDDNWRAQAAGMGWEVQGRLLVEWLYQGLSFTQGAPNLFPLPLLMSCVAMSFALRALTNHYFFKPKVASCLVVLPLWYSPFFLQNLSYQYDGPATALGVVAVIYAALFRHSSLIVRVLVSALCITVGLSLYQAVINTYLGLCCVEIILAANERQSLCRIFSSARDKLVQLLLGGIFYWLTAYQFMTNGRTALREINNGWVEKLLSDIHLSAQRVALLYNDGNAWLCWALLIIACIGLGRVMYRVLRMQVSLTHRVVLGGLCLLAMALAVVSIPGVALIFRFYDDGARLMMGASSALVLVFYLSYQALTALHVRLAGLLIVPVIAMLSFSYAYGRVMILQKELSTSIIQSVAHEMASNTNLMGVERYHVVIENTHAWLVGVDGVFKFIPALKYVLNNDFFVYAEMFPRIAGITNVTNYDSKPGDKELEGVYAKGKDTVRNKFYSIYVDGSDAYIFMKTPSADDIFFLH